MSGASLSDYVERIEAGRSFSCDTRPAERDEWGVLKVSAMTYGQFRRLENKALLPGQAVRPEHQVWPGDLLISRANTTDYVGASVLVPALTQRLLLSDKSLRLVPKHDVEPRWLWQMLMSPPMRNYISAHASGTKNSMRNIGQRLLLAAPMPRVEFGEQQRIVAVLEDHLSRLDAGSDYASAAARRLRSLKMQIRDDAIRGNSQGECRLFDLVERIEAGRSFGGAAAQAQAGEWGVVKVSAMTWGEFRASENKAVAEHLVDPRWEIRSGDVLVSRANTREYVGAPVLVPDVRPRLLLSDKSLRLVTRASVTPAWLVAALATTSARQQVSALASGTKDSMRNISQVNLQSIRLPRAEVDQQAAALLAINEGHEAASRLAAGLDRGHVRQAALRRALLTAAFSGQL